ncbi:MAG: helix-turn-helix transcriptional regulator [Croceibacterium sp.]
MRGRDLVGKNIKRIRVAKGVSQEQLAFDASIDRSYLGGIERCDENPSVDTLDKIATVLGIELADLFQPVEADGNIPGLQPGRKKRT